MNKIINTTRNACNYCASIVKQLVATERTIWFCSMALLEYYAFVFRRHNPTRKAVITLFVLVTFPILAIAQICWMLVFPFVVLFNRNFAHIVNFMNSEDGRKKLRLELDSMKRNVETASAIAA